MKIELYYRSITKFSNISLTGRKSNKIAYISLIVENNLLTKFIRPETEHYLKRDNSGT